MWGQAGSSSPLPRNFMERKRKEGEEEERRERRRRKGGGRKKRSKQPPAGDSSLRHCMDPVIGIQAYRGKAGTGSRPTSWVIIPALMHHSRG